MIKQIPIPTAGVMLGLAALGNLLAPYSETVKYLCGAASALLGLLLLCKICLYPAQVGKDLSNNSIFGSVFATFTMSIMQLAGYTAPFFPTASHIVWLTAIAVQLLLMVWFTYRYIFHFQLKEVFPTYFIAYVGIIVASVTAPIFHHEPLGEMIFWMGITFYAAMFVLITIRYIQHAIPEPAKPLFCIYSAPMSLGLTGYLASAEEKSTLLIIIMVIAAQLLFLLVLVKMPKLLSLPFYPSYAAFTFPFVITAIALRQTLLYFHDLQMKVPAAMEYLLLAETIVATAIVLYVFAHYLRFFTKLAMPDKESAKAMYYQP